MKSIISILILLFLCTSVFANRDFQIIKSDNTQLIIEYSPSVVDTSTITKGNEKFRNVEILFGVFADDLSNRYRIPFRLINIGVPSESGNTIQILTTEHIFIDGKPASNPLFEFVDKSNDRLNESIATTFDELVTFSNYGISRDLRIQTLKINPVQYLPGKNQIKIFTRITFRINFAQGGNTASQVEERMRNSVVNFDAAKYWGIEENRLAKKITNSVLSSGTWYRFQAAEEGMYKIGRSQLSSLGIDPNTVDPRTIRMFNMGGKSLPEKPEVEAPMDLNEIAIYVQGESDGKFDENDYILFYGRGVDFWENNSSAHSITRNKNYSSKQNYFWITSGGTQGKRMNSKNSVSAGNSFNQTYTKAFMFYDDDRINIGKSGRDYWGEELNASKTNYTIVNMLNERIESEPVSYKFRVANASSLSALLTVSENGSKIFERTIYGYGTEKYSWGRYHSGTGAFNGSIPNNNRSALQFSISNFSSSIISVLIDYLEISYLRNLKATNDQIILFSKDTSAVINYRLYNFSNSSIEAFDISDYANVKRITDASINGGEIVFAADEVSGNVSKYLGLTTNTFKSITSIEKIENSNIHGISPGAEYVIITDKKFSDAAQRLKNYRENESPNKLTSTVVYMSEIYNEFSGGSLDPTAIRNFLRYAYQNWDIKPVNVFLFGDGTYDYFNNEGFGNNYIPTYQTIESLDELSSYPMDDYYTRIIGNDSLPELGMGRININNNVEANNYVDKIITYESGSAKGLWRNKIVLVADDGLKSDGDDGSIHTGQAERLSNFFVPDYFDKEKLFLSKYPTVITGLGRRKPVVTELLIQAVNKGTLLLNFTGHGNPDVWTHEFVFERASTIPQFKNDKYFFLTAATCDFGKYDDPNILSGTEEMLLIKNRGAIGVFSAARVVISSSNAAINEEFYKNIFGNSGVITLGEAYMLTKQNRPGRTNDEKFHLFCDPALRLNLSVLPVTVDKVNGSDLSVNVQIEALGEVVLNGSVRKDDNSIDNSYNGEGIISVFDSERSILLEDINYPILEQGGVIFRGRVSVENGEFAAIFKVPKDISYENRNGKIIAYVFNENEDGVGSTRKIVVGGTDSSAVNDGTGPEISIRFDDINFASSYLVNPDFRLLVQLNDESGLNTTGIGVGHKLEGILNDDVENTIDFSNNFIGDLDAGGTSGIIDYPVTGMETGEHKIMVKAWDIFNNGSTSETFFTVVNSDNIVVRDVYNYPNPFASNTTFTFQHNLDKAVNVRIKIYTIAGRLIKELGEENVFDKFVKIDWNGRDEDASQLASGTYLYKLIVESSDGEFTTTKLGKLAVFH